MNIEQQIADCYGEEILLNNNLSFDDQMNFIVSHYAQTFKDRFDNYLKYYQTISFDDALYKSCVGLYCLANGEEQTWFHQATFITYNGSKLLEELAAKLEALRPRLKRCKEFHSLYQLVQGVAESVGGLGPLSIYDTSLRLGSNLTISPEKIYLHSGTLAGYKILVNEKVEEEFVNRNVFRSIPLLGSMEPKYIEDILCIYKKTFAKMKSSV